MTAAFVLDPDTALMLRVRAGDDGSFELLLRRHRAMVISHLYRTVRNLAVAEELAQDVFVRVYRSRERYQPEAKFTTWLFRITTNVALNWRRDTRHEAGNLPLEDAVRGLPVLGFRDRSPNADEAMMRRDKANEVRAAIEALPAKQIAAVLMHKYEGLDYARIAEALHCSVPALKSTLFRAYETLRQRLAHLA